MLVHQAYSGNRRTAAIQVGGSRLEGFIVTAGFAAGIPVSPATAEGRQRPDA